MTIKKIQKVTFIFTIWTILYLVWYRWVMLDGWKFNIFLSDDWKFIFNAWWNEGWVIQGSYFWIFVIMLFLFIPLWILGFCVLASIHYTEKYEKWFEPLIYRSKAKKNQKSTPRIRTKRKKSYMEVRPRALAAAPQKIAKVKNTAKESDDDFGSSSSSNDLFISETPKKSSRNTSFSRREVTDDFEGESPFKTPDMMSEFIPQEKREELKENIPDIIEKSGAFIIAKPSIDDNTIDYLALSRDKAFLILTDAEEGDWLADEERFNDEDPLWFSEMDHRISPIALLKKFETSLKERLANLGTTIQTQIILIKTNGNIINAEDMQSTWEEMGATVARSSFGMPEDLPSFGEVFPNNLKNPDMEIAQKVESLTKK